MAGSITSTVQARKNSGIVRIKATLTCDASGNATATVVGSAYGRIIAVGFAPGTLDTSADITITDSDSGGTLISTTGWGTAALYFRPSTVVTDNTGTAVTAATTAVDVNRDIFVAGKIKVAVANGGNLGAGSVSLIIEEG